MKYSVLRIVGDVREISIGKTEDLDEAIVMANEHCENIEPTQEEQDNEDFDWDYYSGYARVTSNEDDCIIYWVNGDGDNGTDLDEDDERYPILEKHF